MSGLRNILDHTWLHAKYKGRDINPRLQRWLIKLGEYNFDIDYIKWKDNKIANCLSRINMETKEINDLNKTYIYIIYETMDIRFQ